MSLKHNIIANYASQLYVTLIGIVMVPSYVRYMGIEAYGLIGFFTMVQSWFQLLDIGLTPTMARESARFRAGAIDALTLRRLLRALEAVFAGGAIAAAAAMTIGAETIAGKWLRVQQLPMDDVTQAVILMAAIVALRWVSGLYRGAIVGFERQVWLSGFNSAIATMRFVLVLPFFIFVGTTPVYFFSFQLAVAIVEITVLVAQTYRILPAAEKGSRISWQWQPLRGVLNFSLSIAFSSSVWVLVTQTDKLLLSRLLPLDEYAYFTLAVLVAGGITLISGPVSLALQPRLTALSAAGDDGAFIELYRNSTQMVGVIAVPVSLLLAFFPEQILWAWTADAEIAHRAAPILSLYALGNGILALGAFPYYMQFAKGDMRLHLMGNVLFLVSLVPALVWATWHYGVIGAGYTWLCTNAVLFAFWVPKVHHKFARGLHGTWLVQDVGIIVILTTAGALAARWFVDWPQSRTSVGIGLVLIGSVLLCIAAVASSWLRESVSSRLRLQTS